MTNSGRMPARSDARVVESVLFERAMQDEKFGDQSHLPDGTSTDKYGPAMHAARVFVNRALENGTVTHAEILREEFFEVMSAEQPQQLRNELIQLAAYAMKWAGYIDQCQPGVSGSGA